LCKFTCLVLGLLLLSQGIAAEDDEDNIKYKEQSYNTLATTFSYKKDAYSLVMLHVAAEIYNESFPGNRNTTVWKQMYFPKVDEFSELRSNFTREVIEYPNVTVRAWIELPAFKLRSETRVMLHKEVDKNNKKIFDHLVGCRAITIVMDQGVMTDLYWDDSCNSCTEEYCLDDGCSTKIETLSPSCSDTQVLEEDPYHCGIKIYVAWTGTDLENKTLSSFASVPSRFEKYSFLVSAYDSASGFASDFISFWKKPLN